MFHVTEVGAKYGAMFYSLIESCHLCGVNPTTYLVDVLLRMDTHAAAEITCSPLASGRSASASSRCAPMYRGARRHPLQSTRPMRGGEERPQSTAYRAGACITRERVERLW